MDLYDLFQDHMRASLENRVDFVDKTNKQLNENLFLEATRKINRLVLLNQAMTEILVEKLGVSKKEILDRMNEIDMRDGVKDGKYTRPAKDCPECNSKINNEFKRCLFCGYIDESEDPIML